MNDQEDPAPKLLDIDPKLLDIDLKFLEDLKIDPKDLEIDPKDLERINAWQPDPEMMKRFEEEGKKALADFDEWVRTHPIEWPELPAPPRQSGPTGRPRKNKPCNDVNT